MEFNERRNGGWTKLEIFVVAAVVLILILASLSWAARKRDLAARMVCHENLKTLSLGFQTYLAISNRFPSTARIGEVKDDDWVYWQRDRQFESSAIAISNGSFSGKVLWCPADPGAGSRGYPYSFSMNDWLDRADLESISNPQKLILLYEESSPDDGTFAGRSRQDLLVQRHSARGSTLLIDGHVELMTATSAKSETHSQPIRAEAMSGSGPPLR